MALGFANGEKLVGGEEWVRLGLDGGVKKLEEEEDEEEEDGEDGGVVEVGCWATMHGGHRQLEW